jgi:RNA polymerase sigma-70 factor (ECF subfamily)
MVSRTLCKTAAKGDEAAVNKLIVRLTKRIDRLSLHYAARCGEDAGDLRQEAWIGLLEALPNVDVRIGDPEQYLLKYARWRLLDAVRRANRPGHCSLEALTEAAGDEVLNSQTVLNETGKKNCHQAKVAESVVYDFVGTLAPTPRAVLRCLMDGQTWREAGSALGCTSANVAYHVRKIRKSYEDWTQADEMAE